MDHSILEWLLEEENPEVRLRTLKEYEKLPEDDEKVVECKKALLDSKIYERGLKKLRMEERIPGQRVPLREPVQQHRLRVGSRDKTPTDGGSAVGP